jgi:hypothetical protein
MASATIPASSTAGASLRSVPARIPWYLWSLTLAVCLVNVGGQMDVSWHRSIGRDSFWTPPHMMIYACGIISGFTCGWLILTATLGDRQDLRLNAVRIFGLRGPLGAFITAWGGLMMLYSAPVDNWWHNAYGLDVRVVSPPHILLLAGIAAVGLGTLLLSAAHLNRARLAGEAEATPYARLFLFIGALAVTHLVGYTMGYTFDTRLHQAKPYIALSIATPFALAAIAAALRRRWTSTRITIFYTAFLLALVWGLPLIPATPRLGPVYQNITCMVPPKFPLLIVVPALALDFIFQRLAGWSAAIAGGFAWTALLVAAEWPFATFLMLPPAQNRFFGTIFHDFGTPPDNADVLRIFEAPDHGLHLFAGLTVAAIIATAGIRLGEFFGRWMRQIYR